MDRKKQNMLTGSLWDKIILFALPLAATGILQQLFNAADIAVVGRFTGDLSSIAMAAVGTNSAIVNLIVNLFVGLALGANVVIATAIGMGDEDTIEKAVHLSVTFAITGGAAATILCELLAPYILGLIHVPPEVLPLATIYLRIYVAGLPVILLYNFESAIFRAVGDTRTPLLMLALSGVINVALNFLFVAGLHMTVDGVATATVLSNLLCSLLLFRCLLRTPLPIRVQIRKLRIDWPVFRRILRIGIPAGVQTAVFSFANILIQSAVNTLDTIVMAASSAAGNVESFAYYLMSAFGQTCTTFVSQNNGARQTARCKKAFGLCTLECILSLGLCVSLILVFGRQILSLFTRDTAVIETGYIRLVLILFSYAFSLLYDGTAGYLRGFGISFTPALLTTLGVCGVRIFWVYAVFPANPTFMTIMAVYPVSLSVTAVLMLCAMLCLRPARRAEQRVLAGSMS